MALRTNKRQAAKERTKQLKARYFVVRWLDDASKYDTVQSKDIIPLDESLDVLHLSPGTQCRARFQGKEFRVEIIATGTYGEMKVVQSEKEAQALSSSDDGECENSPSVTSKTPQKKSSNTDTKETFQETSDSRMTSTSCNHKKKAAKSLASSKDGKCVNSPSKTPQKKSANTGTKVPETSQETSDSCMTSNHTKKAAKSLASSKGKQSYDLDTLPSATDTLTLPKYSKKSPTKPKSGNIDKGKSVSACQSGHVKPTSPTFKMPKTPKRPKTQIMWKSCKSSTPVVTDDEKDCDSDIHTEPPQKKSRLVETSSSSGSEEDLTHHISAYETKRAANIAKNAMFKQLIGLKTTAEASVTADLAILKDKVKNLEVTQSKLRRKLHHQDIELRRLKRESSFEISSASESVSFESPHYVAKKPISPPPKQLEVGDISRRVDPLRLANAKLQRDPGSSGLKLLDCLFTTEELVNCNPSGNTKSSDPARRATIAPLDPVRMKYIYDYLESKWPGSSTDKSVRRKLTQKCTDYYGDPRYKHLRHGEN